MKITHPESLLRIPLIDFVIHQRQAKIIERPADSQWNYKQLFNISANGFNPFCGALFCAKNSALTSWLPHAEKSAKAYNGEEWLLYECLFLVHDYLHLWAVSELISSMPYLKGDQVTLDQRATEDLAFIYIISEAVATVGLDYWYLSRTNINEICPIGSQLIGLTSAYRESDLAHYQQFNRNFAVQDVSFFHWLAGAYCTGDFYGFSASDLKDARLFSWLEREIRISHKQLRFIRLWLSYMAGDSMPPESSLAAPIDLNLDGRQHMIEKIGQKLWRISQGAELPVMTPYHLNFSSTRPVSAVDFRFTNLRAISNWRDLPGEYLGGLSVDQFKYFAAQFLSSFYFDPASAPDKGALDQIIYSRDAEKLQQVAGRLRLVESSDCGPRDLVFVN